MPIEMLQSAVGLALAATVWGVHHLFVSVIRPRGRMRF